LMQFYQQTARGLRKPGVANALAVQQVAIAQWFNWSAMFDAFAEIPLSKSTHQTLFKSWQKYVDRRSNPHERGYGERTTVQSWWALWLMESIADPQKGIPWFQQQITEWLTHLPTTRHQLGENYEMLQLLTRDLTEVQSQGKSQYPRFYQVVIPNPDKPT
ncbi:MAG: hypothetical protein MUF49_32325, partial [Oculatellaceae cyanobacterium Prado106]|nr:hypothetical protein [Oculatellaceae cyanobacterium Prado106]